MRDRYNFYLLNHMIYNIYNMENFEELKLQLLIDLNFVVPNCCATIFMTDRENDNLLCQPVCHPRYFLPMEERYMLVRDKDFSDWITRRKNPFVIRISDMIDDDEREETPYYKLAFAPFGVHHVVYVTIACRNQTLGLLVLYRKKEDEDFSEDDIFWLEILNEHLNQRFYREAGTEEKESGDGTPDANQLMIDSQLTKRETEVLRLIFADKPNKEICEAMNISENTLKKHLQNLYRKTGVNSRRTLQNLCR